MPNARPAPASGRSHAVFLRAIAAVPMRPLRAGLKELGLRDVVSFGSSGNLCFNSDIEDLLLLEEAISGRLGATAFVRTRAQLTEVVARDPFAGASLADVTLLAHAPSPAQLAALAALDFDGPAPVVLGSTVYFMRDSRQRGRTTSFNAEHHFKIPGTIRSSHVLPRVLAQMLA